MSIRNKVSGLYLTQNCCRSNSIPNSCLTHCVNFCGSFSHCLKLFINMRNKVRIIPAGTNCSREAQKENGTTSQSRVENVTSDSAKKTFCNNHRSKVTKQNHPDRSCRRQNKGKKNATYRSTQIAYKNLLLCKLLEQGFKKNAAKN